MHSGNDVFTPVISALSHYSKGHFSPIYDNQAPATLARTFHR